MPTIVNTPGGQGLSRLIYGEHPKPSTTTQLDYKTHFLIGLRKDSDNVVLIAGWKHLPTQEEISFVTCTSSYAFRQLALVNAVGVWEPESTGS